MHALALGLTVKGAATWFPPRVERAATAIANGTALPEDVEASGVSEVRVSGPVSAPEMATLAASIALEDADVKPDDVTFLAYAHLFHQGLELWSPGHYVANQVGMTSALPTTISQGCDGAAVGILHAANYLKTQSESGLAMIVASDSFENAPFSRWQCQPALVLGDAASAAVLCNRPAQTGEITLASLSFITDSSLELLNRGELRFARNYSEHQNNLSRIRQATDAALVHYGRKRLTNLARERSHAAIQAALREAHARPEEISLLMLPRIGRATVESVYAPVYECLPKARQIESGAVTGHLACGDWLADISDITESNLLDSGQKALVVLAGGGFTWAAAVIERK